MSELKKPPKLRVAADPEKETATVTLFDDDGETSATRKLSLGELDGFISTLGQARGTLVDNKPSSPFKQGEVVNVADGVMWHTQPVDGSQKTGLFFQHPNFGLIGVAIPYSQTAQLISILGQQLELHLTSVAVVPPSVPGSTDG